MTMECVLFHGTTEDSAAALLANGWKPGSGPVGGNMGQPCYLYLSTEPEDALWFANEKGAGAVLKVVIPFDWLKVDPEDGISETVEDEMNSSHGVPGKLVAVSALGPERFEVYEFTPSPGV